MILFSLWCFPIINKTSVIVKKVCLLLLALVVVINAGAQIDKKTDDLKKSLHLTNRDTTAWMYGGVFNIGINEGFLHNWAAGGELVSLNINGLFSGHLERLHKRHIWSNNLDLTYGLNYAYSTSFLPHKTDDRIDFTSRYGIRIDTAKDFFITGLFNFKSQFTKGYDYTMPRWDTMSTSKFMSPAYFTLALGVEYHVNSDRNLFFSPLAGRVVLADRYYTSQSPQGAFGVPYNKTAYYQFGAYFSGRYAFAINKQVLYKTRVDLYSNYLAKDTKDSTGTVVKKDNPGNITVLFDNLLSWRVTRRCNVTIGATFIYDNNIPYSKYIDNTTTTKDDPGKDLGWLQIKQVFTLGLEYKF